MTPPHLTEVVPGLYIRGALSPNVSVDDLSSLGIDRVYALHGPGQPSLVGWTGYRHRPMSDGKRIPGNVHDVVGEVVTDLVTGFGVLVLCLEGRNRSGLVVGLALRAMGFSGNDAVRMLLDKRPRALYNETFRTYIKEWEPCC